MFDGIHFWDLIPLILLALLIFGPKRLPEMGSALGRTIREFQRSLRETQQPRADQSDPAADQRDRSDLTDLPQHTEVGASKLLQTSQTSQTSPDV